MADELAQKLARRNMLNDGAEAPKMSQRFNPATEFPEFSFKEIREKEKMFRKFDADKSGAIDLMELKLMMEALGAPQTHVSLKNMISEIDEDNDGEISLREFFLIFRKAAAGELQAEGLTAIADSIDVGEAGVGGAKAFFEAHAQRSANANKFEDEIKAEQEQRRQEAEEARKRKEAFKAKMAHLS
ncbi:uncharacterized protein MONBRDRAFT_18271 [Monosiga brevicollis MX1]|uniref:EF-hand domain-containing protein n=1 Tax=Monosiga brevicollis TaxID=81824 RepID=A9UV99_MONBE|nr:uncharacterized protein MONBRDRAFT_18271 [Monosiga brevicollis MX1]EDQ90858.1 predicted protein [Monosiga brevicollis MX1]|eukprot:XP_001744155.1 hypothetical protein [Monosiga brevicollis MX1]